MTTIMSWGKMLQDQLRDSLRAFERGSIVNDRCRQVIWGVSPHGVFVGGMTLDHYLASAGGLLADSGRAYVWGDTLVFEARHRWGRHLLLLATRQKADPTAPAVLANLFCAGVRSEDSVTQSMVSAQLVSALLADEDLWSRLPALRYYSRRPLFDEEFNLLGPGYHPQQEILVHGIDIEPSLHVPSTAPGASSIDRLPPTVRHLLQEFCFATEADLANAVALLLTGILANHFVTKPKPLAIIDANQRGVGKSLLLQCFGQLLDDEVPAPIPLVRDEELEKKLGARLREPRSSILFFDNARGVIESMVLEQNALAPMLSIRILGQSANITRPNTFIWAITSNQTSGTSDVVDRFLPIRMEYEGHTLKRRFICDPLDYSRVHRRELLGELAGMVERWKQAGMPMGRQMHRCARWAQVIGGILTTAGLDEFLDNVEAAVAAMDESLQNLAALAEHVVIKNLHDYYSHASEAADKNKGQLPRDWTKLFLDAGVYRSKLVEMNTKGQSTWVGTFLSGKIDRAVTISIAAGSAKATLRKIAVRSDQKRYYFEIEDPVGNLDVAAADRAALASNTAAAEQPSSPTATTATVNGESAPKQTDSPDIGKEKAGGKEEHNLEWV